jgi:hypothetical protein
MNLMALDSHGSIQAACLDDKGEKQKRSQQRNNIYKKES